MSSEEAAAVLVVDDDPAHSQALAKVFERAGYRARTAGDGPEALTVLKESSFDLVITDLLMPGMNGLDLLRNIRAMRPVPAVIVVTAFGEWTTYMSAMDAGAADYLNKPVRRDDILTAARKALARRGIRAPDATATGGKMGPAVS